MDIQSHNFLTLALNGGETKLYAMAGSFPGKCSDYISDKRLSKLQSGPDALE
jgi:hypothetical protein